MHDAAVGDSIKVWFRFVPREGWLPHDREGLWATVVSADTARVDNIPFLQNGVAEGDVVRFVVNDDGTHWATGLVEASGNCTVRVLPVADGPLGPNARAVHERFAPYGVAGETFSQEFPFVALTIRPDADFPAIIELLRSGKADGWWAFEFGSTTEAWRAAWGP
ncbi:DUF4265 domain-containing protein [Dactylosporangium sp. NPDC005572]|uniref:DUF4265 domain-containing protein n=1 Tax=Dactylosporangium sp. NPDC005572 TaxID=3156889 RepID=UPI0033B366A0